MKPDKRERLLSEQAVFMGYSPGIWVALRDGTDIPWPQFGGKGIWDREREQVTIVKVCGLSSSVCGLFGGTYLAIMRNGIVASMGL